MAVNLVPSTIFIVTEVSQSRAEIFSKTVALKAATLKKYKVISAHTEKLHPISKFWKNLFLHRHSHKKIKSVRVLGTRLSLVLKYH